MLLLADEELAGELVHNLPRLLLNLVLGYWVQEVSSVGKSVCAKWTEFWKLELRAPNFWTNQLFVVFSQISASLTQNVTSCRSLNLDSEPLSSLNHTNLARLHIHRPKLSQNVQGSLLRYDQEIAVRVDRRSLVHARIAKVRVNSQTFTKCWIARASNTFETGDEVYVAICGGIERKPC
jgi:hypothetical protein